MKVEMNTMATTLANAINTNTIVAEQFEDCKKVAFEAMQKLLTGETLTGDEITVNSYVARQMQGIKSKAEKQAEIEAKKAEAEAVYQREIQEHRAKLVNYVEEIATGLHNLVNNKKNPISNELLKDGLKTAIANMPAEPKKPGNKTSRKSGESGKKTFTNLREGSVNYQIVELLKTESMTKNAIIEKLVLAGVKEQSAKWYLQHAVNGSLAGAGVTFENDLLSWNAPEIPMEVVTPKK
jgi:hypothetical protein